jgi:hypothetical protein
MKKIRFCSKSGKRKQEASNGQQRVRGTLRGHRLLDMLRKHKMLHNYTRTHSIRIAWTGSRIKLSLLKSTSET